MHCKTLMTGADKYGNVYTEDNLLGATYYDAIAVYLHIQQYTKDPSWAPCVQAAKLHYRDNYVIRLNGRVPGHWNFTTGLALDYQINGDAQSKNAAILLSQNAAYAADGTTLAWTVDASGSREVTYAIRAYLNAEKLGQPRRARLADLINQELGYVDQWFIFKTFRFPEIGICADVGATAVGTYYIKPFMVGLTMEGLIMAYDATGDARIPPASKICLDWLWANAWVPADQSLWYVNYVRNPSLRFPPAAG